tara:strand:- start:2158 stop:3321 length:1164 start_codon:yes stop_codon:yes gene_type:complete
MNLFQDNKAILLLADGTFLQGKSFGYQGISFGEVVFNTGITGYQEVITDPSYFGQLVAFTYPEFGNTGVNKFDSESDSITVRGVIVRNYNSNPSNWRSTKSISDWFIEKKIVGIYGVDTRALVRHIREFGSMNGIISSDSNASLDQLQDKLKNTLRMEGSNLAKHVSTKSIYNWSSFCPVDFDKRIIKKNDKPYKVVAIDFGIKKSILYRLVSYGCEVTVLPANSDFSKVMSLAPEGIFFSNGPGDPSAVECGILLAQKLINKTNIPILGICLGHQIIGLALGGKTYKLNYGHRGLNHPCGISGRLEITSQNHGFALDSTSLPTEIVEVTHLNLNDRTVAGISMIKKPVFGIQYHPEASPGPHDADHHFDRFVSLIEKYRFSVLSLS